MKRISSPSFLYSYAKCVNGSCGAIVVCDQLLFSSNDDYSAQCECHLMLKIVAQKSNMKLLFLPIKVWQ